MHSTTRPREIDDPHDAPAIAPDVVPVTWADRVLADITRDAKTIQPDRQSHAAAPAVDTTFRAAAVNRPSRAKWVASATMAFLFALGSAFAATGWQHYGDRAKEVIAEWTPIISTPYFCKTPERKSAIALFGAVWPPRVGSSASFPFAPIRFISSTSRAIIFSMHSGVIGSI